MRRFTYVFMPLAAALMVSLAACSDYDNGYTQKELQYAKDFKAVFGEIDSEQDWNVAERTSVTVTTQQNSQVKIYALVDGTYSLVGDYSNVNGTQELGFDVRKGVTELIVSDGNEAVKTTVGGSANLGGTRTVDEGTVGKISVKKIPAEGVTIGETLYPQYLYSTPQDFAKIYEYVPEIGSRSNYTNLNNVTHDFLFVSTGSFIIYPCYWATSSGNTIGVYYYENGVRTEKDIFTIFGDELQYRTKNNWGYGNWGNIGSVWCSNMTDAAYEFRSQGIEVNIPAGKPFGMYLKHGSMSFQAYSQSSLNTSTMAGKGVIDDGQNQNGSVQIVEGMNPCYASTFFADGKMYLGFEDWANYANQSDFDLNDVVIAFSGATPTVINEDKKAGTWLLACEDLGGSFDTDYNDVVLKVEHVSGQTTATVTPLAAGGTLASYIFYNDPVATSYGEQCLGEIHQLLGATPAISGSYAPINAGSSRGTAGTPKTINVDENWSMAYYSAADWNTTKQYKNYNMGGFEIRVLNSGTDPLTGAISSTHSAFGDGSRIAAPDKGEAPMMLCLPYTYWKKDAADGKMKEYVWAWSQELYSLSAGQGYGDGTYPMFAAWVEDRTQNTDWYMYPSGGTVSELILAESDDSGEGGEGEVAEDLHVDGAIELSADAIWTNQSFPYTTSGGTTTTVTGASFLDFSSISVSEGQTATVYVRLAEKLATQSLYWDYKDGTQIFQENNVTPSYYATLELTAEKLAKVKASGGIYIAASNQAINVVQAQVKIEDGSGEGDADYSALYGTYVEVNMENVADYYPRSIQTSSLPTTGNVTITYIIEGDEWTNTGSIYGLYWDEVSNPGWKHWENIALEGVTTTQTSYKAVSVTVDASTYANWTYIYLVLQYSSSAKVVGAYYK